MAAEALYAEQGELQVREPKLRTGSMAAESIEEKNQQAPEEDQRNPAALPDEQGQEQEQELAQEQEEETPLQKKGRPRSEKSRKAILKATNALLLRMSVQELSIEAIAKKAKVGKTTIYRWWPNKTAVVMDALIEQPGMQAPLPSASSHSEAIEMQLDKLIRLLQSHNGETIAQLFSEAQADPRALKVFEENFLGPLTDALQYSIECGQRDGEFRTDLDTRMAVDMLCGPAFFRLLSGNEDLGTKFQYAYPPRAVALLKN